MNHHASWPIIIELSSRNETLRLQPPVPSALQRAPATGSGGKSLSSDMYAYKPWWRCSIAHHNQGSFLKALQYLFRLTLFTETHGIFLPPQTTIGLIDGWVMTQVSFLIALLLFPSQLVRRTVLASHWHFSSWDTSLVCWWGRLIFLLLRDTTQRSGRWSY